MRGIQKRAGHAAKQALRTGDIGIPGHAHAVSHGRLRGRLVGIHPVVFEVARRRSILQRGGEVLLRGICDSISELRQVVVGNSRHNAFSEVVVAGVDAAGVDAEVQSVPPARPGQVVVDLPLRDLAPLRKRIVQATDGGEGRAVAARDEHDGEDPQRLGVVARLEDAGVPVRSRIELIHQSRTEQMRVTDDQGALRLRRVGVENRVDRICPFRLQARILLEAIPDAVFGIDRVIDLQHDEVLSIAVVQRPLLQARAAAAIEQCAGWRSRQRVPGCIQRAGRDRHRRPARSGQQRKHVFVEWNLRGLRRQILPRDGVITASGILV